MCVSFSMIRYSACTRAYPYLKDEVGTFSNRVAFGIIEEDLGAPPEEIFDFVYPDPVASASIGQVCTYSSTAHISESFPSLLGE